MLWGHSAQKGERRHVPVQKRLGGFSRIGLRKAAVAVGQVQDEVMHLALHTGDHRQCLAEITLGMARSMGQRHEHLPNTPPTLPHVVLDYRLLTFKAVLVPQPLKDALRRVPLLLGCPAVRLQYGVNYAGEGLQLRLVRRPLPRVALRRRIRQHLAHRVPMHVEHPGSLPNAHSLHHAGPAHPKIYVHVKHPSHLPWAEYQPHERRQAVQFSTARIRRSSRPRGTFFSPPFTLYDTGYAYPSDVSLKIVSMAVGASIECSKMGLTKEECPQPTTDTARRVLATLMTKRTETNGPGQYGNVYNAEFTAAINRLFYGLIDRLQQNPCGPLEYGYVSDRTLNELQASGYIHKCGQGWAINSEWAELIVVQPQSQSALQPAGLEEVDQSAANTSCDRTLRSALIVRRGVGNAKQANQIVRAIQAQRAVDCNQETWNPFAHIKGTPPGRTAITTDGFSCALCEQR